MARLFVATARFQLAVLRRSPDYLMSPVTIPLLVVVYLAIMRHADRLDLASYAILGSAMMTVWATALFVSGDLIEMDRMYGTLEGILASPSSFLVLNLGRIATVTAVSFLGLLESMAVAWIVFGVTMSVPHLGLLVVTLLCTVFAMMGTASIMSALFVLARSPRIFQNTLSYPVYLLGGAIVPTSLLPEWLQPISRLVFLSWTTDLLRDCVRPGTPKDVVPRLAMILVLGLVAFAAGATLSRRIIDRLRSTGSVGLA